MKPHYIDHEKSKGGKLWNSKRDARHHNCVLKGQGKKPVRPKGGETLSSRVCDLPVILGVFGEVLFTELFWDE